MPKKPPGLQSVAGADAPAIIDVSPASIGLLLYADTMAHSLAAGWGGPPVWFGIYLTEGQTAYTRVRVPPGIKQFQVWLLAAGKGSAVISAANHSTSTTLTWSHENTGTGLESAKLVSTGNANAVSGNGALAVVTWGAGSAAWSWGVDTITVANSSAGGADSAIYGMMLQPLYFPQG